jgi:hypothetical protein
MYKIIIKGESQTDYSNLYELDGIDCQDNFSDYFDSDASYGEDVTEGYMRFEFDPKSGKLFTVTEYLSNRELTQLELDDLEDYTSGQWSDGIGEGFEQTPCHYNGSDEVYISPWFMGQKVVVDQIMVD